MFANVIAIAVGCVLAISAASKWRRPRTGVVAVERYGLVPSRLAGPVAAALLLAETVLAGVLLAAPALRGGTLQLALAAAAGLFLLFCAVVAHARRTAGATACGCLGEVVELRLGSTAAVLNGGLAAIAAAAAIAGPSGIASAGTWVVAYECALLAAASYWLLVYGASVRGLVDEVVLRTAAA